MCDNEPSTRQILHSNDYWTKTIPGSSNKIYTVTPTAYGHGKSLVENAIGRIRAPAGTLVHNLEKQS